MSPGVKSLNNFPQASNKFLISQQYKRLSCLMFHHNYCNNTKHDQLCYWAYSFRYLIYNVANNHFSYQSSYKTEVVLILNSYGKVLRSYIGLKIISSVSLIYRFIQQDSPTSNQIIYSAGSPWSQPDGFIMFCSRGIVLNRMFLQTDRLTLCTSRLPWCQDMKGNADQKDKMWYKYWR